MAFDIREITFEQLQEIENTNYELTDEIKLSTELQKRWIPFVYKFGDTSVWIDSLKDFVVKTGIFKNNLDEESLKNKIKSTDVCLISNIFVSHKHKFHILNFIFVLNKQDFYFPENVMRIIIEIDKQNWWLNPIDNAKAFVIEHAEQINCKDGVDLVSNTLEDLDSKDRTFKTLHDLKNRYLYLYENEKWMLRLYI